MNALLMILLYRWNNSKLLTQPYWLRWILSTYSIPNINANCWELHEEWPIAPQNIIYYYYG